MTKRDSNQQRGAFAVMTGILMLVLVAIAGLAVDLGTFYGQASDLQSAADAAALAGAIEQERTGSPTAVNAEVDRVLRANGLDTADPTVSVSVTVLATGEVTVTVTDTDVELFFSSVVLDDMEIGRSATAFLDSCGATCTQEVDIAPPFSSIEVVSTGDGWVPILLGDRIYAINHHTGPGSNVVCVDRVTETACPGYPRPLESAVGAADIYTSSKPEAVVHGDRIFYETQTATDFGLGCWNTSTDQTCGMLVLANLPFEPFQQRHTRGGGIEKVGDRAYLVDDHHWLHCVDLASFSNCPSYPRQTQLGIDGVHPNNEGSDAGGWRSSLAANNKYYTTIPNHSSSSPQKILCWDLVTNSECSAFGGTDGTIDVTPSNPYIANRLFFRNDSGGNPISLCNLLTTSHECFHLITGATAAAIPGFDAAIAPAPAITGGFIGDPYPAHNRTFFARGYITSITDCWNWTTGTYCGRLVGNVGGSPTMDYGYAHEGDCIIAFGDRSIFWTFDIDMNVGCSSGTAEETIYPCICSDGQAHWGSVRINGDLRTVGGPFEEFIVHVLAPDGSVVLSQDMMDTNGHLDLDAIPTSHASLTISIEISAKPGQDPWGAGQIPTIEVGWRDQPYLTN